MSTFGEASQLILRPAHGAGDLQRVTADALRVSCGLVVTKIDGRTERLQGVFITALELLESLAKLASAIRDHFFEMMAVVFDLLLEILLVKGTLQAGNDGTLDKRFNEIVVRAGAHGLHTNFDVIHACSYHERQVGIAAANLGKKLQPTDAGHLEVGNDRIEALALQSQQGLFARIGGGA